MNITDKIKRKGSNKEKLAGEAIQNPNTIPVLLEGLNNENPNIKYGCDKVLRLISEERPELLYPYFDDLVSMLDSENNILKWGAIITLSNLASVDTKEKFNTIFKKYYAPVKGPIMITAANIVSNSWKISKAKPHLTESIVQEILNVEKASYINKGQLSSECKNVVCGHAISSFNHFYNLIKDKKRVNEFVKKQLTNTRNSTKKKAEKFIRKYRIVF